MTTCSHLCASGLVVGVSKLQLLSCRSNRTEHVATVYSGQFSLLPSAGWEMSSSSQAVGQGPDAADWGYAMSDSCRLRVQLFVDVNSGWLHSALLRH